MNSKPYCCPDTGVIIYPTLPSGMRVATIKDFVDEREVVKNDIPFLVKSFHYDRYELHKSKAGTPEKWKEWLEAGHIFVKQ